MEIDNERLFLYYNQKKFGKDRLPLYNNQKKFDKHKPSLCNNQMIIRERDFHLHHFKIVQIRRQQTYKQPIDGHINAFNQLCYNSNRCFCSANAA